MATQTSLLTDQYYNDLDVIRESSENSESSASSRNNSSNNIIVEMPAMAPVNPSFSPVKKNLTSPRRSPKPRGSPSRKMRTSPQQIPTMLVVEADDDNEDVHQHTNSPSQSATRPHSLFQPPLMDPGPAAAGNRNSHPPPAIMESEEYEGSGETEKLTDSDNEDVLYDIEEGDEEDCSEGSLDAVPHLGDVAAASRNNHNNEAHDTSPRRTNFQLSKTRGTTESTAFFDANSSVMMFDYDEEEDEDDNMDFSFSVTTVQVEEDQELTWRLDPSESLSDWTVNITNQADGTVQAYHVHKNIMAIGKRRSEYFTSVFKQLKGNRKVRSTEVTLPDRAAQSMPMFLDYMYLGGRAVHISPDSATGLRFLAQYFGVRNLFEKIMRYIQRSLSLKTLMTYYKGCSELGDQKILKIAARHCARNIHLIDVDHEIITEMDPVFLNTVLASPGLEAEEKKLHMSILVAKFCEIHKRTLDEKSFEELTSEENLPIIHHSAALGLLEMEADVVVSKDVMSMMKKSNLQERCIRGLVSQWKHFTETDPERTAQICRKLPSPVVTELLLKSLDHTRKDAANAASPMKRQGSSRSGMKREGSQKAIKAKKEEADKLKAGHEEAMAKLKAEYEAKMSHLQDLCYEKDKHIKKHYEEILRFKRLPNSHDGKLVTSGRSNQPTRMPDIGKHSSDGYLLAGRKLGGKKYPVFYYQYEEED